MQLCTRRDNNIKFFPRVRVSTRARARVDVGRDFVAAVAPQCTKYTVTKIFFTYCFRDSDANKSCSWCIRTIVVTSICSATDITHYVNSSAGSGVECYRETETSPSRHGWRPHDTTAYILYVYVYWWGSTSWQRRRRITISTKHSRPAYVEEIIMFCPVSCLLLLIHFFLFSNRSAHIL